MSNNIKCLIGDLRMRKDDSRPVVKSVDTKDNTVTFIAGLVNSDLSGKTMKFF